jgi:flagellar biogenesis protein FliO
MFASMFRQSPLLVFPLLALLLFVTVFALIVWRVLRSSARAFDSVASLPLGDEPSPQGAPQ